MQLSHESYRTRWLILVGVWAIAAFALIQQAIITRDYLTVVGALGLNGKAMAETPFQQAFPAFAADAEVWVRHSISLLEGNSLRLRYTTIDNAPYGREVHWNSAWAWTIAGSGWIYHQFTGVPLGNAVERATIWLAPVTLFVLVAILSAWVTARVGAIAGVVVVAALICNDRFFEGFFPSYVDHHGLLTVSVFAMILGAVLMGGGWWEAKKDTPFTLLPTSPQNARSAAAFSGFAGACGLWVSAASVIPAIAFTGIAGIATIVVQGRRAIPQGTSFDGGAWRTWGRVGAAFSLFFYLLEYFPQYMGFRLEPNHPFHAMAWLGGGELIAQFGERWLAPKDRRWAAPKQLLWPLAAISLAPITVLIGGVKVFAPVLDPFMSRLHNDYIVEFLPLWKTLRAFTGKMMFQVLIVDSVALIAAIATITYRRRETPLVLSFATAIAAFLTVMAWMQSRWLLNAAGAQACLTVVVLACWTISYRPLIRWIAAIALIGVVFLPSGVNRYLNSKAEVTSLRVSNADANAAVARDIARALRATQPKGDIVMLASPNASTQIGYYGRFKTLGTLYWENAAGLKAAASILGAPSETEAADLIRKHGVTHIALILQENFIAEYYKLLHPKATDDEIKRCFGYRLLGDKVVPQWLQMIPYRLPADLKSLNHTIMLFKVDFKQTLAEALYHIGLAQVAQEAYDQAQQTFTILTTQAPQLYQPWLRQADIYILRRSWQEALDHMLKGISLAPEAERSGLYSSAAGTFYTQGQQALTAHIYRTALAERRSPEMVCYLAWILATSNDASLRNGEEALKLAHEALRAEPTSPTYLSAVSAALAELGRFPEAVSFADRAVANSKTKADAPDLQRMFLERLTIVKSGKALRN